jgi:hypothetical protein
MSRETTAPEPASPNTGRILDYWLGGNHHLPVDVEAARAFESIYGDFPGVFRTLRDFIGRAARYIGEQGIDQFLVLGSGIPTQGNVHEAVPQARVLYTDIDPLNVQLGQEILAGNPDVGYTYCDANDLSTLDQELVRSVLGPLRRLGIVVVGVGVFIPDDRLRGLFAGLYEWAPGESHLAFDFDSTRLSTFPAALEMLGDGFHMRTPETFAPLLGPWELTQDGIQPAGAWRNPEGKAAVPVFMYGGVAVRREPGRP